jgi:ribonuclease D
MISSSAMDAKAISRDDLAALPICRYAGPVCLVDSLYDLARATHDIRQEPVVGFDTETRPSFHKGQSFKVSLVQIATAHEVFLFQLNRLDFAPALTRILESAVITKVGVALADDLLQLKKLFPFTEKNILDLGQVARRQGIQQTGVRNLAGLLLGQRITKSARTSNWASHHLTAKQITYAATDAWVCRELYRRFEQLGWLEAK